MIKSKNSVRAQKVQTQSGEAVTKLTNESQVIFITYEQGAFKSRQSNTSSKALRNKVMRGFKDRTPYKEPEYFTVIHRSVLPSQTVNYLVSTDSKPYGYKGNWDAMSKLERLRVHLTNFASDKVFEFKIVD